jgi:hypothetical protein|tara:strand:+ start:345 stop:494 length:150 start_codon:yes stop_codon:yes gene_type:complete
MFSVIKTLINKRQKDKKSDHDMALAEAKLDDTQRANLKSDRHHKKIGRV